VPLKSFTGKGQSYAARRCWMRVINLSSQKHLSMMLVTSWKRRYGDISQEMKRHLFKSTHRGDAAVAKVTAKLIPTTKTSLTFLKLNMRKMGRLTSIFTNMERISVRQN